MKLNHIGLNIRDKEEIERFYKNILDFRFEHHLNINDALSAQIFDIPQMAEAFLVKKDDLMLELFHSAEPVSWGYAHVCIEVEDREQISGKCFSAGYPVVRMKRDNKPDLLFIKDRTGNIFEIKQKV